MRGYLMVTRTFRQPGANYPVDMRGYLMVTRNFRQVRANEPIDAQRLTSSSVPFVVMTREVR